MRRRSARSAHKQKIHTVQNKSGLKTARCGVTLRPALVTVLAHHLPALEGGGSNLLFGIFGLLEDRFYWLFWAFLPNF